MRLELGINNWFALKRWPRPADWAPIVRDRLGRRSRGRAFAPGAFLFRSRPIGGTIPRPSRISDLWGCVVSTGPGYRRTRAEDATGPR